MSKLRVTALVLWLASMLYISWYWVSILDDPATGFSIAAFALTWAMASIVVHR